MKSVLDYLEAWSRRERIVQKEAKIMRAGEVWRYPVSLEKGVDYSFKARGCRNGEITCILTNGDDSLHLREVRGSSPAFTFVPEKSGAYGLTLSLDPAPDPAGRGKVVVTLAQEYMPARFISGMFR
jgi:hypothetical protein